MVNLESKEQMIEAELLELRIKGETGLSKRTWGQETIQGPGKAFLGKGQDQV